MIRTLVLATTLLAAAATAQAQTPPAPPPADPGRPGMEHRMGMQQRMGMERRSGMERMCEDLDARMAARVAFAEVKVQPTDAQRSAWDAFSREARAAVEPIKRLCADASAPRPASYAERLVRREKHLTAMVENTRAMRAAVDKLQPALSEEQRTRFGEAMDRRRDGAGPGGHRFHRGHH